MAYNIKLEVFEGPLDLLLHLIKENEVDIHDIPIAKITQQYLEYIEIIKALNLDVAGEFLVMASTLTYIKSKTLLPKHEQEEDEDDDGVDPREELVAKLIEYKKFKEASLELKKRELEQSRIFTRSASSDHMPEEADLLQEVNVFELFKSFKRVLENYSGTQELNVTLEEISVTDKLNDIMARMELVDHMTFDALFDASRTRGEVIATFLALLELVRLKLLRINQARVGSEILLYKALEENGPMAGASNGLEPEENQVSGGHNETKPSGDDRSGE